jgi:PAS domain S-box-containing protein
MNRPVRVLLVEDHEEDAALVERELKRGGFAPDILRVETAEEMRAALRDRSWDVVVADYNLPRFSALGALELLRETGIDLPFIIVSGGIGEEIAAAAMKAGAHDYLMKDTLRRLVPAIDRELRDAADRALARRAEEALRESEARYRVLFQHAADAIVLYDYESGLFMEANPEAERLYGLSVAELTKLDPTGVSPEIQPDGSSSAELSEHYIARAVKGEHVRFEWMHLRPDGSEIPCEVGLTAFRVGPRLVVQGIVRDITQRKAAEAVVAAHREELRLRVEELQRANVEIESFLYTVSHDLKAPLVTLHGMIGLLLGSAGERLGPVERHYIQRMRANVDHMQRLVEDLLDMARLGRTQEELETFDVSEALLAAAEQLGGGLSNSRLELSCPARLGVTRYDKRRLLQIFANLLSNAIHYASLERRPQVEIRSETNGDVLTIHVRDNGIGIEERFFDRIFQIFEKVSPGTGEGTGVGLSIVKKIVELHGGQIWVRSKIGEGSTFSFTVPNANPSH